MPAGQRHVLLQHLGRLDQGERGLLANARCLAEGVDVPTLDGVAFIDPRRSEVDIVQAVGRAIRLASDKTVGTIVIPVFIDTDDDPAIALDDSAFKPVWDVIMALRSHDDQLGEQLDELRRQLGRLGRRPRLPGKIHLRPARKGRRRFRPRFRCAPRRADHRLLGVLVRAAGTVCRTTTVTPASRGPTRSMATSSVSGSAATRHYARGTLDADRQRRLEDLPGWTWDPHADRGRRVSADSWTTSNATVTPASRSPTRSMATRSVGGSTSNAQTRRGTLDADRQRRLQDLPGWTWDPVADQWEEGFSRLLDYVERHGDARVPKSYTVDGYPLGEWVVHATQRPRQRHP